MNNSINVIRLIEDGFVSMGVNTLKSMNHITEVGLARYDRIFDCAKANTDCIRNPYLEITSSVLELVKYNAVADPCVPFLYPLFVVLNNCMCDILYGDERMDMGRIFEKIKDCADRSYSSDVLNDLFRCMHDLINLHPALIRGKVYTTTESAYKLYLESYVSEKHKHESHVLSKVLTEVIATGPSEDIRPTKKTTCGLIYPSMDEAVKELRSLRYNRRFMPYVKLLTYAKKIGIDTTALSDALKWDSDAIRY